VPGDPIRVIQECVKRGRIFWTYHVNMRLRGRSIPRRSILTALERIELVEAYTDDKYLPSYLVLGRSGDNPLHILVAVDSENDNVRIVTAYRPNAGEWHDDLKTRRSKK